MEEEEDTCERERACGVMRWFAGVAEGGREVGKGWRREGYRGRESPREGRREGEMEGGWAAREP